MKSKGKVKVMKDDTIDGHLFFGLDITGLRQKKLDALIGYMSMDIFKPPEGAEWGTFNDRAIDESWVADLLSSFRGNNLDNSTDETAIDITVKTHWIKNLDEKLPTVEGKTIDQIPEIIFTEEGVREIKNKELWMMGGNHRRLALQRYVDELTKDQKEKTARVEKLKRRWLDGGIQDTDKENAYLDENASVQELEKKIKSSSKWSVRLYDRGKPAHSMDESGGFTDF